MLGPLKISDFDIDQVVFEVRYNNAYVLWDRSGEIWAAVSSVWPNIKINKVVPNNTLFKDENYEFSISLDRTHVIEINPISSLDTFISNADKFYQIAVAGLGIKEFTRIGFRIIYSKECKDKLLAAEMMLTSNKIITPKGKHFNIEGRVVNPMYSMVWEDDNKAIRAILKAEEQGVEVDIHPSIKEVQSVSLKKQRVVYDVDYYTKATVSVGQLNVTDWISQVYHVIKRDSKVFLGEI